MRSALLSLTVIFPLGLLGKLQMQQLAIDVLFCFSYEVLDSLIFFLENFQEFLGSLAEGGKEFDFSEAHLDLERFDAHIHLHFSTQASILQGVLIPECDSTWL